MKDLFPPLTWHYRNKMEYELEIRHDLKTDEKVDDFGLDSNIVAPGGPLRILTLTAGFSTPWSSRR